MACRHRPAGGFRKQNNPIIPMKNYPIRPVSRQLLLSSVLLAPVLWSSVASAGTVTLQLVRSSLTNVNDAAGLYQHEGGNVKKSGATIGQYLIVRRVTNPATSPLNTAATSITLFIGTSSATAPNNITLQGAHNFSAGNFRGSVSAAANRYTFIQGADSSYTSGGAGTSNLVMTWNGSNQLTVP